MKQKLLCWLFMSLLVFPFIRCDIFSDFEKMFPKQESEKAEYKNTLARHFVVGSYSSEYVKQSTNCNGVSGQICLKVKQVIPAGAYFLHLPTEYFLSFDQVIKNFPTLYEVVIKGGLDEYINPTVLFTLQMFSEVDNADSFILSTLGMQQIYTYDSCGTLSSICTPLMWTEEERMSTAPSMLYDFVEREFDFLSNMYELFVAKLFPEIMGFNKKIHTKEVWIELFAIARACTFIEPGTQKDIFAFPLAILPHNPDSDIIVHWLQDGFFLQADRMYMKGEEITINYWELLGSLSSFGTAEQLSEFGVDLEDYEIRREAATYSLRMLLYFGQVHEKNLPNTSVLIDVKIYFDSVVIRDLFDKWVRSMPFVHDEVAELRLSYNSFPEAFMIIARVVSLSIDELCPDTQTTIESGVMISLENEIKAMRKVLALLDKKIDSYAYPIEYIEEIRAVYHRKQSRKETSLLMLFHQELSVIESVRQQILSRWRELIPSVSEYQNQESIL